MTIVLWLLFGAVVGWLASIIMHNNSGLIKNIILGIIGSLVGGFVASLLGFGSLSAGFTFNLPNVIISVLGACLVIFLARFISKR